MEYSSLLEFPSTRITEEESLSNSGGATAGRTLARADSDTLH